MDGNEEPGDSIQDGLDLCVSKIPEGLSEADVKDFLSTLGTVTFAVIKQMATADQLGYGFFRLSSEEEARKALDVKDYTFKGKVVCVGPALKGKNTCRNFQEGNCKFGDKCHFTHDGVNDGDRDRKRPRESSRGPPESRPFLSQTLSLGSKREMVFTLVPGSSTTSSFGSFLTSSPKLFVNFMRGVINFVEKEQNLKDYHLCVVRTNGCKPNKQQDIVMDESFKAAAVACGFYVFVAANSSRTGQPPDAMTGLGLDEPLRYTDRKGKEINIGLTQRELTVWEDGVCRASLDAQAREMYVVCMVRHVTRQNDLSDDELYSLWLTATKVVAKYHTGDTNTDTFQDMRLNAGSFQNVLHLHLKVWIDKELFGKVWESNKTYVALKAANTGKEEKTPHATHR